MDLKLGYVKFMVTFKEEILIKIYLYRNFDDLNDILRFLVELLVFLK